MARYATEHKQRTRRRIVDAAGRRLKSSGLTGSGVATLMADAGLTNGALYAHFASKDELVARVVTDQLDRQRDAVAESGVEQMVRATCRPSTAITLLTAARPRRCSASWVAVATVSDGRTPRVFSVSSMPSVVVRLDPHDPSAVRVRVLAAFAGMAGTLQMARAITDRRLSDELLDRGVDIALAHLRPRGAAATAEQEPGHIGDPVDEPVVEGGTP